MAEAPAQSPASVAAAVGAIALFLDLDGTLIDIADHPDAVKVEPALVDTLERLRQRLDGALAIVSGRALTTIDRLLAPARFDAAGLHGAECRIGTVTQLAQSAADDTLARAAARLRASLPAEDGFVVEDKGRALAVHWRRTKAGEVRARQAVAEAHAELGPDYRVQNGKSVAELLPAPFDKGRAVQSLLAHAPHAGRRPLYIGDDLTDEQAFATVNALGGLSVRVGPGETQAQRRFEAPSALRAALTAWADGNPPPLLLP